MRYFVGQGHHVTIISPIERRENLKGSLIENEDHRILRVRTLNNQKTNVIEKLLATTSIDYIIKRSIKSHLQDFHFDMAIYSTPPITLVSTIKYLKKTFKVSTYLLLKDIFPQNAVDLGMIKKSSFFYSYFRKKERILYDLSDKIGCMSQANVDYVLTNNRNLTEAKVEICPNSLEPTKLAVNQGEQSELKESFGITSNQTIFIYGGNLGKPQGVDFLIEILESLRNNKNAYFIIIGSGTEFPRLMTWFNSKNPDNVIIKSYVPKVEYDQYVQISDVGLIFLDYNFTIPNYPSRLLGYLENSKPILAFTDDASDIGKNAEQRGYGRWGYSNDIANAKKLIEYFVTADKHEISQMGATGKAFYLNNYQVNHSYAMIMNSFNHCA